MFISNNHDSFHLWWHENFVKHQNVSKYYDQDCRFPQKTTAAYCRQNFVYVSVYVSVCVCVCVCVCVYVYVSVWFTVKVSPDWIKQ